MNDYELDDKFANRDLPGMAVAPKSRSEKLFLAQSYVASINRLAKEQRDLIRELRDRALIIERHCNTVMQSLAALKLDALDAELDAEANEQ